MSKQSDFLTQYDLTKLEEMDPSLADGFQVVYDREIPLELRLQDISEEPQEVGTLESIRTKILAKTSAQDEEITQLKIEMTSETDLFFHYTALFLTKFLLLIQIVSTKQNLQK